MKICKGCGVEKDTRSFYAHNSPADGLFGKCMDCCRAVARDRYYAKKEGCVTSADKWPFRLRSRKYLKHIRGKPCLHCGRDQTSAHHLTHAQPRAMGKKTGDQYTVPLCHKHHMELHQSPMPERTWWSLLGIDPVTWAEAEYAKWEKENGDQ